MEVARFIPKGTGLRTYKIEIFDLFGNVIWESSELDDEGQPIGYGMENLKEYLLNQMFIFGKWKRFLKTTLSGREKNTKTKVYIEKLEL